MTGIFKVNEISTIGGTTPQGEGIEIVGQIGDWTVVTVEDSAISGVQEFNIQPIDDNYLKGITGPQAEGAYNAAAYGVTSFGDKMRFENNPDQIIVGIPGIPDGTKIVSADEKDTESQKNFTSEDVAAYKQAQAFIKKYDAKSVLRNQIRGNIVDVEDDIADTKVAVQTALYYFAHEWQSRTQAQKDSNPAKEQMEQLSKKLLSDDVKMRADLKNGIETLNEILEKEEIINQFIANNYSYNANRGL
jgi:hypothetical protein